MNGKHADLTATQWRKSTHSNGGGGCIEVADGLAEVVPVRDSTNPSGPALVFPSGSFEAFIKGVKNGSFGSI